MASIWKHPESRYWTACFRDESGRQRRITTKETNRPKALKIAQEFEKASREKRKMRHTREVIERLHAELTGETFSKVSLRAFAREWLGSKKAETSPRTIEFYRKSVDQLVRHLGTKADEPISEIAKADLIKFRNAMSERGLASKTINNHVKCARMLFKAARRDSIIAEDPSEFVATIPKERNAGIKRPFTIPQLRAVLGVADPEWRSLVLFGLYTGQRLGDLARLPFGAIDFDAGELRFRTAKTGRMMAIPLPAPLRKYIESLPWPEDPATPLHPRAFAIIDAQGRSGTLSREFGELLAQAGLRPKRPHHVSLGKTRSGARTASQLSFHSLRRTATTLLHEAGIPQAVAQALIGHDSAAVHEVYISVGREALVKAAASFPDVL